MNARSRLHVATLRSDFEVICILSSLALVADFIWVMHDIHSNGISTIYVIIASLLFIALVGTVYICWKHHIEKYKELKKVRLAEKLAVIRHKRKQNGTFSRRECPSKFIH